MTTRNLTSKFEQFRQAIPRNRKEGSLFSTGNDHDGDPAARMLLSSSSSSSTSTSAFTDIGLGGHIPDRETARLAIQHAVPPEWVDLVETIQRNLKQVRTLLGTLETMYSVRIRNVFSKDEVEQDRDIQVMTHRITDLLKESERSLKRIATIGNPSNSQQLTLQERTVRLNVMRGIGLEMHELSKSFRNAQKNFMQQMQGREEIGNDLLKGDSKQPISIAEAVDRGLTAEQLQQLNDQAESADERHKQIIQLAQSINELASIFRELSVLVIEQGTVLDRIDYNIEQAMHKVETGTQEMHKANEYSKKARTIKCILALLFLVIILILVLVFKHTDKK